MPLFNRRNAVKHKQAKTVPKESPKNDEQSVISEINSMLSELVSDVSEQTESELKVDRDMNLFPVDEISKQIDTAPKNGECSNQVLTNSISQQKDSSRENECSSSILKNIISEQKNSVQENDACGTVVLESSVSKQICSTPKYDECTDIVETDDNQNQTECSQDKDTIMLKNVSKQIDFIPKNEDCSAEINDVSNETSSAQKDGESKSHVTTNDISAQNDQTNEETSTLSANDVLKEIDSTKDNNEFEKPVTTNNVSNEVEKDTNDSNVKKSDSQENEISDSISTHKKKASLKKTRSSSEYGSSIESQTKYVRRKFGSEAEILSICQKILPLDQQKGINDVVGKYIDKLIKESIFQAVKSINVKNLCEELIRDVSNRKNSESTESEEDFIVEQRLSSNSISELVEFQNVGSNADQDKKESSLPDYDRKASETESLENETDDHVSFRGYLADLEDTASVDDSLCNSSCSGLENIFQSQNCNSESSKKIVDCEISETMTADKQILKNETIVQERNSHEERTHTTTKNEQELTVASEYVNKNEKPVVSDENDDLPSPISPHNQEKKHLSNENLCENGQILQETGEDSSVFEKQEIKHLKNISIEPCEVPLISLVDQTLLEKDDFKVEEHKNTEVKSSSLPSQNASEEERMKINWKVGNLQVKLPHKSRGKTSLKTWKKRRVVIQPDEFVNDPTNQSLVISVYGSKKHETTFWYSVSSQKAVVFRSSSHTHRYAFTISESGEAIIHLSAENESDTQEWMAAIRAVLWPPSPFMELEKMLSGQEFEVSIIDNEFSYHAGLLGMYGYLSITPTKMILLHPQQGYVIQEWYLNTVDKFQFVLQSKAEDNHKVLCMTTCKDSSTGQGDLIFFCKEAVTLLQALASNIHQVLSYHSKQEGGKYQKELEELAEWMIAPPQDCLNVENDEHYKVPPRQVKSLLDIPNFIFNKSLSPVASAIYPAPNSEVIETMDSTKNKFINTSQDSGISTCTSGDDFLNCSTASFVLGGGPMTGKSSDSELSDSYTPPRTPEVIKKKKLPEVVKEETSVTEE